MNSLCATLCDLCVSVVELPTKTLTSDKTANNTSSICQPSGATSDTAPTAAAATANQMKKMPGMASSRISSTPAASHQNHWPRMGKKLLQLQQALG